MNRHIVLLALCGAGALTGCASAPGSDADRAAISGVLDDWNQGWRVEDASLAAAGYSDDADFTNAFGFHRVGREAIREYLAEVFALDFVMAGVSADRSVDVRFIRDDVALVRTRRERTGQRMPDGSEMPTREITHLRVFRLEDDEWRIVSHLISDARETQRPRD